MDHIMGETDELRKCWMLKWHQEIERITNETVEKLKKIWVIKMEKQWMFQITIEDELMFHQYPNFQIKVATKEEMRDMIKNYYKGGLRIKINKCKKTTNADWLYLKEYEKWWNDQNLVTPDCLKHH